MRITIQTGQDTVELLELPDNATVTDLKNAFKPRVDNHRKSFRLFLAGKSPAEFPTLSDGNGKGGSKTLAQQGVIEGAVVVYKDLGPQIGYRTVFYAEYGGPIAFALLYWARPALIYGAGAQAAPLLREQTIWGAAFVAHFVKRELETLFVHKFSHPTMPLSNLFKNCAYYWTFAAVMNFFLFSPSYTAAPAAAITSSTGDNNNLREKIALTGWLVSEILNFVVHYTLSNMRSGGDGDTTRKAPRGGLFSLCSCPNYFFEVLGWAFFSYGTGLWSSWAFTAVGCAQMAVWARKKHRDYVQAEPDLKRRGAMFPWIGPLIGF